MYVCMYIHTYIQYTSRCAVCYACNIYCMHNTYFMVYMHLHSGAVCARMCMHTHPGAVRYACMQYTSRCIIYIYIYVYIYIYIYIHTIHLQVCCVLCMHAIYAGILYLYVYIRRCIFHVCMYLYIYTYGGVLFMYACTSKGWRDGGLEGGIDGRSMEIDTRSFQM
jgi:hypothetical protein